MKSNHSASTEERNKVRCAVCGMPWEPWEDPPTVDPETGEVRPGPSGPGHPTNTICNLYRPGRIPALDAVDPAASQPPAPDPAVEAHLGAIPSPPVDPDRLADDAVARGEAAGTKTREWIPPRPVARVGHGAMNGDLKDG